jgi:hypothetical protein
MIAKAVLLRRGVKYIAPLVSSASAGMSSRLKTL